MKKTSLAFLSALFAGNVFAQATPTPQPGPGWEIVWCVGVPISPLASVLIAISLAGATYAFARRKRGQSLIALCIAAIAGVFAMSDSSLAVGPTFTIPSKSGATVISCNSFSLGAADDRKLAADPGSFEVLIGTSVDEGVTLTTVRQIGVAPSSANTVQPQGAGPLLCDFGNGITSIKPQPDPVIYLDEGNYKVVLEVDNKEGCKSSIFLVNELIFFPKFAIKIVDSFCLNQSLPIENNTIADVFSWDFGINANTQMSNLKNPENIKFLKPGDQTIKLTATSKFGCNKDTTFIVKTSKMDASFQMDPPFGCSLPLEVNFRANVPSYPQYEWNTISGKSQTIKTIDDIKRDTFYYNKLHSIPMILKVTSEGGCTASDTTHFYYQLPNSQFSLNNFEGEVPYLLTVQDKSESLLPIAKWIFNWGDGTSNEYNQNNIHTAAHLYTEIGKYYVNLTTSSSTRWPSARSSRRPPATPGATAGRSATPRSRCRRRSRTC